MKKNLLFIVLIVLLLAACTQFSRVKKASILAEESKVSISLPKLSTFELTNAFEQDGYVIDSVITFQGKRGIKVKSTTAVNYETKEPKVVYYLEGTGYQMGYMFGQLAHEEIELMCTQFLDGIIEAFLRPGSVKPYKSLLGKLMADFLQQNDKIISRCIPQELMNEMVGIVAGCQHVNPDTKVTFEKLFTLNVGIDFLLAQIYNIDGVWRNIPGIKGVNLRTPIFCNAFSATKKATVDGKHYFGRDFMFPAAGVFQNIACMIIYVPDPLPDLPRRIPLISVTAPGFVGSITAMNTNGFAMGVDMVPAGNLNARQPGLNSLLLVRHTAHYGSDIEKALRVLIHAPRGVPWLYPLADAESGRGAVIEAGVAADSIDFLDFPSKELKDQGLLPSQEFLTKYDSLPLEMGLKIRWDNYEYPDTFFYFNTGLFIKYQKPYHLEDILDRTGFIDSTFKEPGVPKGYYFAPQRERKPDLVLASNMYMNPSMRLCSMAPWTIMMSAEHMDDTQWRYDALNKILLTEYGKINFKKAEEIIDFLAPNGKYYTDFYERVSGSDYFYQIPSSSDGKTLQIFGATSICNLTDKIIKSHFGYFADKWIRLSINNYIKQ
jgi:hypothetical protein